MDSVPPTPPSELMDPDVDLIQAGPMLKCKKSFNVMFPFMMYAQQAVNEYDFLENHTIIGVFGKRHIFTINRCIL